MMNRPTPSHLVITLATALCAVQGCSLEKADDVSEYREALPDAEHVSVAGPGQEGSGSSTLGAAAEAGLLADGAAPAQARAEWYRFTRNIRNGVNAVTASVLGSVWFVVHTKPTTVGDDFAEWGPYTDALEPVTWRLRVERVAAHEYEYRLDGRPRGSNAESDFVSVLDGKGYGRADARHGDGTFTIDLDAARRLDPDSGNPDDSGTVTITHDLPPGAHRKLGALPREITAELDPAGETHLTIESKAHEDGSGELEVSGLADLSDENNTQLEQIAILSRFREDGAGRADVVFAEGDVPASVGSVTVTECWGSDFSRVYYADSVESSPTEGDPSACVYDAI